MFNSSGAPPDQLQPLTARRAFGMLMIIVGVLMVGGAGLCGIVAGVSFGRDTSVLPLVFLFSGPFILVGALLWWGGARLRRPQ